MTSGARSAPGAFWLGLLAATAGAAHVVAATRTGDLVASVGEARLAAGALAARGIEFGGDALPLTDRFAAGQLAMVQVLLPIADVPVVDAARWAELAFGLVTALLLWPLLRRLGVGPGSAALAVAVAGVLPPAVALHTGVTAAGPAAMWLVIAAVLAAQRRPLVVPAAVAAGLAAVTSPLAAAVLLAIAAHLVLDGTLRQPARPVPRAPRRGPRCARPRRLGPRARRRAAGRRGWTVVGTAVAAAGTAIALTVLGAVWLWVRWLRPVVTGGVLLLAVLLVPGPARSAAAVLVLPLLAVVAGVVADQLAPSLSLPSPRWPVPVVPSVLVLAVAVALVASALVVPAPQPQPSLTAWASAELAPGAVVRADPLDRAELAVRGFPPEQLHAVEGMARPGELVVVTERPDDGAASSTPGRCAGAVVAVARQGTGGAPTALCPADAGAGPPPAGEAARRARFGTALAGNPRLRLAPEVAAIMRSGQVDARLLLVLGALTRSFPLAVTEFPATALEPPDAPRRRALITVDGAGPAGVDQLEPVRSWLRGQQPPFVPTVLRPTGTALLVGYPAPSPAGLLPDNLGRTN